MKDIRKGIDVIDKVVPIALRWMNSDAFFIEEEFEKVFRDYWMVRHCIDKWSEDNDFARFYLNMDMVNAELFFKFYSIPLSADPFNGDDEARLEAQIKEDKKGFDLYPFETEIVRKFYLYGYNNSLEVLKTIAPQAFERVAKENIDFYGNGLNWSNAWMIYTEEDKTAIISHILNEE